MPTKKELEQQIAELNTLISELQARLTECERRGSNTALAELLTEAPEFPIHYNDHLLAIEQGFKPGYVEFLAKLKALV
jgi:hypothetical protein